MLGADTHAVLTIIFIKPLTGRVRTTRTPTLYLAALVAATTLALSACGSPDSDGGETSASSRVAEQAGPTPRLALSYDGGVLVLDATTLEQIADIPIDGFVRLNTAANGRNVFVSAAGGFRVIDMGTWTVQHGDHGHSYTTAPKLTELRFGGAEPGHVVPHDARIALFSDGTGDVDIVEPAELADGKAKSTRYTVPEPHHGVAVSRGDGSLVVSVGDEDSRTGVAIIDRDHKRIAGNDQCPGVHGEAAAAGGVLVFGCEDGLLVVDGNNIRKVASPDAYGRIGNQAGAESSPIVLGDYKTQKDAKAEHPNRFTLTDTRTGTLRVVPFPASYSFRGLERGPNGEALILGTDGALHLIDAETGAETAKIPVIERWTEPTRWQDPMPNLFVLDSIAYVSDPATRTIHAVDLTERKRVNQAGLDKPTIELTGVTG